MSRLVNRQRSAPDLSSQSEAVDTELALGPLNEFERRHAPDRLYLAGDVSLLSRRPKVSVVGSRQASDQGLRRTSRLSRALVANEIVVVSGLAEGIDTAAHRAAIDAGGRTIAVIGTPLDKVYPRQNAALQALLARDHLVVSRFPPGGRVHRSNFPTRNRMMALIVDASVIVEAGDSSGTLSQGWEALRLGRALFIMRSVVENRALTWPKQMLEYGAQVLDDAEQVVESIPYGELAPGL